MKKKLVILLVLLLLLPNLSLSAQDSEYMSLYDRADLAQDSLTDYFLEDSTAMYNVKYQCFHCNEVLVHYWWFAHAFDVLVDGYERTGEQFYLDRATEFYSAIHEERNYDITIDFYDDMLWMALGLLRLYEHTNDPDHEEAVLVLWEDILTGWNDTMDGGIAWNKNKLGFKNTPSNAPAIILAARLYQKYGDEEYLEWAHRIYDWQTETLVNPENGYVYDGINGNDDGLLDTSGNFTYNQGTYIGGALEMYKITGEQKYLDAALKTAETTVEVFADDDTYVITESGSGDGGLFKGILVRYLGELIEENPDHEVIDELATVILASAESAWAQSEKDDRNELLFGASWEREPALFVELAQHLSGVKVMEQAARVIELNEDYARLALQNIIDRIINKEYDVDKYAEEDFANLESALAAGSEVLEQTDANEADLLGAYQDIFWAEEEMLDVFLVPFDWEPDGYGTWEPLFSDQDYDNPVIVRDADNSSDWIPSARRFTQEDLPVGSVIEVTKQDIIMNPNHWATDGREAHGEPDEWVFGPEGVFVFTEEWWEGKEYFAINGAKLGENLEAKGIFQEVVNEIKVYVPGDPSDLPDEVDEEGNGNDQDNVEEVEDDTANTEEASNGVLYILLGTAAIIIIAGVFIYMKKKPKKV